MAKLCIGLFMFTALLAPAQQPAADKSASSDKLWIPAQLSKTVRADKAHAGDPVEFRTLEAVLVSKGLVMPANTPLHGRVLSASAKREGKNSWLALVVERAEWQQHSLLLHAFVMAQITLSPANNQNPRVPAIAGDTPLNPRRGARQSGRMVAESDPNLTALIKAPQESTKPGTDELAPHPMVKNVAILRDKDGTAYLISSKNNVELPAGVWLMLENQPVGSSETRDAGAPDSRPCCGR